MSVVSMDEEPLNLCLKDEQRFTDSGNEDRFSSPGVVGSNSSGEEDDDEYGGERGGDDGSGTMAAPPESDSSTTMSVLEQINSLRKFIHEKRLSKFYEMYLMQLRVRVILSLLLLVTFIVMDAN